jgi:NADPH:quinone reductase-like Zn-dependent oxidoreductase
MVKALGADTLIDYLNQDFTQNGEVYDVVFDAVGKLPSSQRKTSLKRGGRYFNVNNVSGGVKTEDLLFLKTLIEDGKLTSVIDRTYPIEQIVEAHRYVDQGHKKGNVAITVATSS